VLAALNVWVHVAPQRAQILTGLLAAVLLLAFGRGAGLSWSDLGLGHDTWARGLAYGAIAIVLVAAGYGAALAIPALRGAFRDTRYRLGPRAALFTALVTIPLGTVLFEEVAFRSVLYGLIVRERDVAWAIVISSLLFGLWHVLPALDLVRTNSALAERAAGSRAVLTTVAGTVAFTSLGGLVFAGLRWRSGSLFAPMGLHWATNAFGVLASARLWAVRPE
jgi:membrane protease YdiL (CAAX protease family)